MDPVILTHVTLQYIATFSLTNKPPSGVVHSGAEWSGAQWSDWSTAEQNGVQQNRVLQSAWGG